MAAKEPRDRGRGAVSPVRDFCEGVQRCVTHLGCPFQNLRLDGQEDLISGYLPTHCSNLNFCELFAKLLLIIFQKFRNFCENFTEILLNLFFGRRRNFGDFFRNFAKMQCRPWRLITDSEKVPTDVCRAMRQGSAFRNFILPPPHPLSSGLDDRQR